MSTIQPTVKAPKILVNGVEVLPDVSGSIGGRTFTKREPQAFASGAVITMTHDASYETDSVTDITDDNENKAIIRYNFRNKKPALGPDGYLPGNDEYGVYTGPITLTQNRTGADLTVIEAKTFYRGRVSEATKVTIKIV